MVLVSALRPMASLRSRPNERCSRQALFGCGFAAMVIVCLQLNLGVRRTHRAFVRTKMHFDLTFAGNG